jgi:hypothetical protein
MQSCSLTSPTAPRYHVGNHGWPGSGPPGGISRSIEVSANPSEGGIMKRIRAYACMFVLLFIVTIPRAGLARFDHQKKTTPNSRTSAAETSNHYGVVHDVGQIQLHITNWGLFGSYPTDGYAYSDYPSAEWPAGSGIEYLNAAGLWVGAYGYGGIYVSTCAFDAEFRPTSNPIDSIYHSFEGAPNGKRLPDPQADDDGDGRIDEDWLNGWDDDLDGLIDEDFAAVSTQMHSCWYTDNQPASIIDNPAHNPLNLLVRQMSYQWDVEGFDDFIGIEYTITNIGYETLYDVYVGFFTDFDVGPRDRPDYWEDDAAAYTTFRAKCTNHGPVKIDFAYGYDADGDEGQSTGYFGVLLLNHSTESSGDNFPRRVGVSSYCNFSGTQSFEEGGDPTNDFERYMLLSSRMIERNASVPRDYRNLMSVGPFDELEPDSSIFFHVALVAGTKFDIVSACAAAGIVYNGEWHDLDGDPQTGVDGREHPFIGPGWVSTNYCLPEPQQSVPAGSVLWVNEDCWNEEDFKLYCGYTDADSMEYRTGVGGKETQARWMLPGDAVVSNCISSFNAVLVESGVKLQWETKSSADIEGYRIYRKNDGDSQHALLNDSALIPSGENTYVDRTVKSGVVYQYTLGVLMADGSEFMSDEVAVKTNRLTLQLHQNYPNPFKPSTKISFVLPENDRVKLSVYNVEGKLIRMLIDEVMRDGYNDVIWDGRDSSGNPVGSGIYFFRLRAGGHALTKKMLLLK